MSESLITKKAIASGLKEICKTKNMEKVSIADITSICGLNRQTFYYHFQDKYELLNWIYYNEIFVDLIKDINFGNWDEHIYEMLEKMKKDKSFYLNTIKNCDTYFKEFLFNITVELFKDAVENLDDENKVSDEDKKYISEFYAYGICGVILSWVKNGMKEETKSVASNLKKIAMNSEKFGHMRYVTI